MLFRSIDGGGHWLKLQNNLPTVAVRDMVIQERDRDLVAGTFGRAIWVTDIAPFAEMSQALEKPVHLFGIKPATLFKLRETYGATIEELNGDMFFRTEHRPYGTMISYYLRDAAPGDVSMRIEDAAGELVQTLKGPGAAGIHRVNWDLKADRAPETGQAPAVTLSEKHFRERVPAGLYKVTLEVGGNKETRTLVVRREPADGVKQVNVRK